MHRTPQSNNRAFPLVFSRLTSVHKYRGEYAGQKVETGEINKQLKGFFPVSQQL